MTDLSLFWAYSMDAIQLITALGMLAFLLMATFSRYIRPFVSETLYNMRLWIGGKYSVLTGAVKPGTVTWERAHPDMATGIVDATLEWAKR